MLRADWAYAGLCTSNDVTLLVDDLSRRCRQLAVYNAEGLPESISEQAHAVVRFTIDLVSMIVIKRNVRNRVSAMKMRLCLLVC